MVLACASGLCGASLSAAEVTVTRLDGGELAGDLQSWDDKEIVVITPKGDERIATAQLVSLRWSPAPEGAAEDATPQAELIDGTLLPIEEAHVAKSKVELVLAGPHPAEQKTLTLPVKNLVAIRLRRLEAPLVAQWDETRELKIASDMLVLLKRDGKSLDYVEGVLGDISAEKVDFKMDGETVKVDRAKVAGVIYYRTDNRPNADPRCVVHSRSGLEAGVLSARLHDDVLEMKLMTGDELRWPAADVHFIDFSSGKILHLSDIEAASDRWTPLVGLPAAATAAAERGRSRRNQSAFGGPLTLRPSEGEAATSAPLQRFNKGLAVRSRTEMIYRLPSGFRRFIALAGIDPATGASGNVRLTISGNEKSLLDIEIAGDQPPHPIDLDVSGVKQLKIVVDYGQNLDTGDWLNLCDARIVK